MADELTEGEKAYLESGGENAEGLLAENAGTAGAAGAAETKPVVDAGTEKPVTDGGATKAPVQADADDDDDDPRSKDPKATVPYQKHKRDLKKLQERLAATEKTRGEELAALQKQIAESNEKFARGDERLRLLAEAMQTPAQEQTEEDPEPDPNEDIIGWAQWSRRENQRLRGEIAQTREATQQTRTTFEESAAETRTREAYQTDAAAFARETPDFMQAYNHLVSNRAQMLIDQGYPEPEVRKIIFNEEKTLVQQALQRGQRPAAVMYTMAKRMGYQPQQPAQNGNGANGKEAKNGAENGGTPARNASVVEEIERIQRGQEAAKSLSGTGGGASELTVEALASMSDSEFQALYASKKGQIDNLLGKRH